MKIAGVGAGRNLLTAEARDAIENASVIYGSKRAIELVKDHIRCEYHEIKDYSRISELPDDAVVLSTGDPMLSGLGRFAGSGDVIIPGISSLQIACVKLGIEETGIAAITAHARDISRTRQTILRELELGKTVFILPDPQFDLHEIARFLLDHGFSIPIAVCEQLSYPDERIAIGTTVNPPDVKSDLFCIMIGDAIIHDSHKTHKNAVAGVLGPEGTFSEQAAKKWIDHAPEPSEFRYFDGIGDIISSIGKPIDYGVVPIENSLEGSIGLTLDALLKYPVTIVDEIILPIQHCLLAKSDNIHTIMSHPQAIAQCRQFLHEHFRDIDIQVTASTAHAAKLASANDGIAAIAPAETAMKYGLNILFEDIQNVNENYTRFVVLGTEMPEPTGHDKTSIAIDLRRDRPGALYELLGEFASRNINLTKIESRPTKKALGDYLFYIDFQGHVYDGQIRDTMQSIKEMVAMVKVLGSYPQA